MWVRVRAIYCIYIERNAVICHHTDTCYMCQGAMLFNGGNRMAMAVTVATAVTGDVSNWDVSNVTVI